MVGRGGEGGGAMAEVATPMPAGDGAGPSGAPEKKRFEIKKWTAIATWSWAICTDTCAVRVRRARAARRVRLKARACVALLWPRPVRWCDATGARARVLRSAPDALC